MINDPDQQGIIQYLPPLEMFYTQSMDLWTNNGFPPTGNARVAGVSIAITGTFMEGHRTKVNPTDSYTHVIICDANVEIRDSWKGQGNALSNTPDYITIPAGSSRASANWWKVVYSFVTTIPGTGQRRVILCDRWQTPGTWSNLP
jgi:hypothetical protein